MTTRFELGDHVRWNPAVSHVSGKIVKVHKKNAGYKGYTHHASADDPRATKPTPPMCNIFPR